MLKNSEFQKALHDAIQQYIAHNPWRANSDHRRNDISQLRKIIDTANNEDELITDLLRYFSHDEYYTGALDRSDLEERLVQCILDHDAALQKAIVSFSPTELENDPQQSNLNPPVDSDQQIVYSLSDYIEYAIQKYEEEKSGNPPLHRQQSIRDIRYFLGLTGSGITPETRVNLIHKYLNNEHYLPFEKPFRSAFKQYILDSIALYNRYKGTPARNVKVRTWPVDSPKKIMIFLHGWRDSRDTATPLAELAQQNGFEVITYDHRGHGDDDERHKPKSKSVPADLFRLDFQKFLAHVQTKYPGTPIAIVGHSMGGSVVAAENNFIQKQAGVKNITLLAPAVTKYIINLARPDRKLHRTAHNEVKKWYHIHNRKPGKTGAKTFTIPNLLLFMRQAMYALIRLFSNKDALKIPVRIYAGKQDYYLIHHQVDNLKKTYGESSKLKTFFFRREDHTFPVGRHRKVILPRILEAINSDFQPAPTPPPKPILAM